MNTKVRIGIVGDFDGRPSHLATQNALLHSAKRLAIDLEYQWLPTVSCEEGLQGLSGFDGLWGAPGSPYISADGAIRAIRFARESVIPFIGTCGGFQHAVIEYGRNVLHIDALLNAEFDLYATNDYISELSCSLVGQTRQILFNENSKLSRIYGGTVFEEKYNCNFGLNKTFQEQLDANGLKVVGMDKAGEARIMTIESHPFFVVTLYQPQLSSTPDSPHPLINEYLRAVKRFSESR